MKALRKILRNQKGQALAEYHVLIPGSIVLIGIAYILSPGIMDIYRHMVYILMGPKPCVQPYGSEDNFICDQHEDCELAEWEDMDHGYFELKDALSVDSVVIKAGRTYEIRRDDPYQFQYTTYDGCYLVTFKSNRVEWDRIGTGQDCQGVSHIDVWEAPICE